MTWINAPDNVDEWVGFVYIIRNKLTNQYYIGQKKFHFRHKLKPLKGQKKCRHKLIESDWKDYYGSSMELLDDIKQFGKVNFKREIIVLCKSKATMNYYETQMQFKYDALLTDKSYNKIINCRINHNQVKNIGLKACIFIPSYDL